jgi:hypothetical protein
MYIGSVPADTSLSVHDHLPHSTVSAPLRSTYEVIVSAESQTLGARFFTRVVPLAILRAARHSEEIPNFSLDIVL